MALRLMFCDLNGQTLYPMSLRMRQRATAVTDLPASDVVPRTIMALPRRFPSESRFLIRRQIRTTQ